MILPEFTFGPDITTTALGYGAMSIAGAYGPIDADDAVHVLEHAHELGIRFHDTANIYGAGLSEELLSRFLPGRREEITLASKAGIVQGGAAGRRTARGDRDYLHGEIDGSLSRLGVDHLDLYYLHRVDPNTPVEESVAALAELVQAGKVRSIGLSEATAEEIRRAHAVHPIAAVQSEWSLFARDVEEHVLPTCAELGIGFVAYSPVARGLLSDRGVPESFEHGDVRGVFPWFSPENLAHNAGLAAEVQEIAAGAGIPTAAVAIGWLHARAEELGVTLATIPGTRSPEHLDQLLQGPVWRPDSSLRTALDGLAHRVAGIRSFDPAWVSGGREGLL